MTHRDHTTSAEEGVLLGPPIELKPALAFVKGRRARVEMLSSASGDTPRESELLARGAVAGKLRLENGRWHFETSVPAENPNPGDPDLFRVHEVEMHIPGETKQYAPHLVRVNDYDSVTVSREVLDALPDDMKGHCPRVSNYLKSCLQGNMTTGQTGHAR